MGRPRQYLRIDVWEKWLDEHWTPFTTNDFWHLKKRCNLLDLKINFVLAFLAILMVLVAISLIT